MSMLALVPRTVIPVVPIIPTAPVLENLPPPSAAAGPPPAEARPAADRGARADPALRQLDLRLPGDEAALAAARAAQPAVQQAAAPVQVLVPVEVDAPAPAGERPAAAQRTAPHAPHAAPGDDRATAAEADPGPYDDALDLLRRG
jgi:hypothetical protein